MRTARRVGETGSDVSCFYSFFKKPFVAPPEILSMNLKGAIFQVQINNYPKFGNFSFFCHRVEKGLLGKSEAKRNNINSININSKIIYSN